MRKKGHLDSEIIRIFLMHASVSRPELIRETGARPATLLKAIDGLKAEGLLVEPDRAGVRTGRRAPLLHLNGDYQWTLGIDFQADKIIGAIVDFKGELIDCVEKPAQRRGSPAACCEEIRDVIELLKKQNVENWHLVKGIGFADPGLVDGENGISLRAVNIPGWENVKTGKWLSTEFRLPAGMWPECLVRTHMEYRTRLAAPPESLFHISLGDGVGGGFIRQGEPFTGANNRAMEIGHVIVAPDGPLCQCGNRGCLEALAGINGIRRKVEEVIAGGVDTELTLEGFSLEKFVECSRRDKAARIIAGELCDNIGKALAVVVTLLNPSVIVLGGETAGLGEFLEREIRRVLNFSCFAGSVKGLKIEFSSLPPTATALGAALLMRDKLIA
jgi:glucokinase